MSLVRCDACRLVYDFNPGEPCAFHGCPGTLHAYTLRSAVHELQHELPAVDSSHSERIARALERIADALENMTT